MHKYFSDWYKIVEAKPQEETVLKRWKGIEGIVKNINENNCFDLARVYMQKKPQNTEYLETFRGHFQKADKTFQMADNDLELQVLAGSSAIQCFNVDNSCAIELALSIVCSDFQGLSPNKVFDIFSAVKVEAQEYLINKSITIRRRQEMPRMDKSSINFNDDVTNLSGEFNPEHMKSFIEKLQTSLLGCVRDFNGIAEKVESTVSSLEEEVDLLWWAIGEYSNDLDANLSEIDFSHAILIIAKELADKTNKTPGPPAVKDIAAKVISALTNKQSETTIQDAINKAKTNEWMNKWIDSKSFGEIEDLCPVHYAARQSLQPGSTSTSWLPIFEGTFGIKPKNKIDPLNLLMQTYNEILLIDLQQDS
jgi:hypothetical protein